MQKIFKPAIFMACLIPFIVITYQIFFNKLGAEPVKEVTHHTGNWTLRFILISLAMTPLRNITNSLVWTRYRSCLLYTSPSPRDRQKSRMPSSA